MNHLLQVKLRFRQEKGNAPGPKNLSGKNTTSTEKVAYLIQSLQKLMQYYDRESKIIENYLIDVHYNDIIAKSRRISEVLKPVGRTTDDIVVGARFSNGSDDTKKHIITYYADRATIERTIDKLEIIEQFLDDQLSGKADTNNFNVKKGKKDILNYDGYGNLRKSNIRNLIVDCSVIDSFSIPHITDITDKDNFLITFYHTELSVDDILERLHVSPDQYIYHSCGKDTLSVSRDLLNLLNQKVPYLISMVSSDISKLSPDQIPVEAKDLHIQIPDPQNEPVIGVIDTLFDDHVYFGKWVENHDYLDDVERHLIHANEKNEHGTEVDSIIVDGPQLNPYLDDHCGRFRVRHFGVCVDRIAPSRMVRKIRQIVIENPDIHVWNLSLGTEEEVSENFISFDGAALDDLQAERNIVFVVAGTNDNRIHHEDTLRVGSPADSLNSIVVNSVRMNGEPASYARKGNILSFFTKPDFSYYGGDYNERINVCNAYGLTQTCGTSYAAPWISRKLCYLIDVMGLSREVAKALLIDVAGGWKYKESTYQYKNILGYGIVPIDIRDVLNSAGDEIRFFIYGTMSAYKMTNYQIPVPKDEEHKYPYVCRAVLCYFPKCYRSQGVDYTGRELSLKFGRISDKGKMLDINHNTQDDEGSYVNERKSRSEFRKWENSKFISALLTDRNHSLKAYEDRLWGISITSKERLKSGKRQDLNFGAVITLKEINGINRIDDFIRECSLRGYIVEDIDIQNRISLYNRNQEDITIE